MSSTVLSVPQTLWHLYVDNLVFYKSGSWVDSAASTFRVLAFATIFPFILLTLFDVASYVIARTLGVIDATKASTSGELDNAEQLHANKPAIVVHDDSTPTPSTDAEGGDHAQSNLPHTTPPASYFRNPTEEEGNLRLAGVGTFSPAPSQPGSPTLQRREFLQHSHYYDGDAPHRPASASTSADSGEDENEDEGEGEGYAIAGSGAATPRDVSGLGMSSAGSSSGDSSFAMLDRDSGSEDAGVVLRRRSRRPGTGPEAEGDGVAA
ncbi:uncharacterized protein TRAVEDRAFT_69397 [Trametes versicolor FP-101664 SS1]|uniref:uncharacterized protein n=1 Tax=Trametes versicolor (strain FP-101664) TaxID=717944 RepID=UPI000462361C|nr:uncharacterized protein TRAVEDRAFT_69397 [Trametes versicolor FP-101664 SS1]EIW63371.1 hypothetical protein TRAVEDRAFT_69397 [Trametes versicolor FP-101664 SS1]